MLKFAKWIGQRMAAMAVASVLAPAFMVCGLMTPAHAAITQPASSATASQGNKSAASKGKPGVAAQKQKAVVSKKKVQNRKRAVVKADPAPARPSFGQLAGLHKVADPLDLNSSVALVVDQDTQEVLFSKNEQAVLPIASLTKLMTGLIISEAILPMEEMISITQDDIDTEKFSSSRLRVGAQLSRGELLHLALMASENRAAHALGRTYPGGLTAFVSLMNAKARMLGMLDTTYVDPTGLSSRNQSSAKDLALLVRVAAENPLMRELSTSPAHQVAVGRQTLQFNNTNRLVKSPAWDISLQKTGYISEAGRCLVMQARIAGRKLIMVFLDSAGKVKRLADAERVRHWIESMPAATNSAAMLIKPV